LFTQSCEKYDLSKEMNKNAMIIPGTDPKISISRVKVVYQLSQVFIQKYINL